MRRGMVVGALLAGALVLGAFDGRAQARCAPSGLVVRLLTPSGTPVERAFVIGLVRGQQSRLDAMPSDLAIARGEERIALRLEPIAPGLARATVASAPSAGTWQLVGTGVAEPAAIVFAAGSTTPPPSPPVVSSLTFAHLADASRRGPSQDRVTVQLFRPIPAGVVAVTVARSPSDGAWVPVVAGATAVLTPTAGRCETRPEGYRALPAGTSVSVGFVDGTGRVTAARPATIR